VTEPNAEDLPPGAFRPLLSLVRLALRPLDRFLHIQAASGVLLLVAATLAMAWANSPWGESYRALWQTTVGIRLGPWAFDRDLAWVVNDGLMVIFFFVVGLEIRRELDHGELSELRRAALPVACALGGMLVPAGLYLVIARSEVARPGWGVPMATDIAFAVGVLALLGTRVPPALRVLLLALAVIDDLGAILVIALFYSSGISFAGFLVALSGVAFVLLLQAVGVRQKLAYVPAGVVVWAGIYAAGVHPTIAGVIIGLLTPVAAWRGASGFLRDVERTIGEARGRTGGLSPGELARHLDAIHVARREALSPAESLIELLHPWVAFGIMPLFALANAGVSLAGLELAGEGSWIAIGTALGLVLGKPLGILLVGGAAVGARVAILPAGLRGRHLLVVGVVAGIGFTMSLFIAQLAFDDPAHLGAAKLGVLIGSLVAGLVGWGLGRALLRPSAEQRGAASADEAESSTVL
jgi:NhaA family Na+:H+ antiporter